jgi:hypothetical protein
MTRTALALFAPYAFHTAMMADKANLCGNDETAFKECSE